MFTIAGPLQRHVCSRWVDEMNHIIEGFQIRAVEKALGSGEYQSLNISPVQSSTKLPLIVMMQCPSTDSEQGESRLCKNKLAKARKTRKSPDTLSLKNFGPGKLWVEKVLAQFFELDNFKKMKFQFFV